MKIYAWAIKDKDKVKHITTKLEKNQHVMKF